MRHLLKLSFLARALVKYVFDMRANAKQCRAYYFVYSKVS